MSDPRTDAAPRRDLWIPACFVLFFVALAGLQLWFVLLANRSFTGLVTDPRTPAASHAPVHDPGWSSRLAFTPTGPLAGRLTLTLREAGGGALEPERLIATAERTTRFPQLLPVDFERRADGAYTADLKLPLAGDWAIRLTLVKGGERVERIEMVEVLP